MEANEAQELKEHAEHGSSESALRPVAFTMSVLAVLVAVTTVLGHRTHTEAVLNQNKATDKWNRISEPRRSAPMTPALDLRLAESGHRRRQGSRKQDRQVAMPIIRPSGQTT